jgi:hypothetical protein
MIRHVALAAFLVGGAVAWPLWARAQIGKLPSVGILRSRRSGSADKLLAIAADELIE